MPYPIALIPWFTRLLAALAHPFTRLTWIMPHVHGYAVLHGALVIGRRPRRKRRDAS
jgi:hypothetical protein